MILTGAFLAEAAAAVDNKLHIWGGVISHCALGPERVVRLTLVALTQAEADNSDRTIDVDIRPPNDEETLHVALEVPEATAIMRSASVVGRSRCICLSTVAGFRIDRRRGSSVVSTHCERTTVPPDQGLGFCRGG